jgi:hypothetical protein
VGSDANLLVLDLPDSVHAMVMARVDALSADALLTLKVASVIGHSFSLATLAAIHPLSAGVVAATSTGGQRLNSDRRTSRDAERYKSILARMQSTCNQLVSHALLRPCGLYTEGGTDGGRCGSVSGSCSRRSSLSSETSSTSGPGGAGRPRRNSGGGGERGEEYDYVFVSQLVREGVYNMLPFAQRARLHGAVAATLEREMASLDASDMTARRRLGLATYEGTAALAKLGSHWRAARKLGRAQAYTQRAAQCAATLHEVAWARSLLESALAISEEREEAASRADRNSAAGRSSAAAGRNSSGADGSSAATDRNSSAADGSSTVTDRNSSAADGSSAATDRSSAAADRNSAAGDRNSAASAGGDSMASGSSGGAGGSIPPHLPSGGEGAAALALGNGGGGDVAPPVGGGSGRGGADQPSSERLLGPSDLEREIATLRRLEAWVGRAADTGGEGGKHPPPQPWRATSTPLLIDTDDDRHAGDAAAMLPLSHDDLI